MYLFGGSNLEKENNLFLSLDLKSFEWSIVVGNPTNKQSDSGDKPKTRDEHSMDIYGDKMVIFGGFVEGYRTNEI